MLIIYRKTMQFAHHRIRIKKLNHFLFKSNYNGIIEIVNKLVIKTEKDDKSINGSRTAHF